MTGARAPTFADFAKDWTSGELRKKYPDHVREKKDPSEDVQISPRPDQPADLATCGSPTSRSRTPSGSCARFPTSSRPRRAGTSRSACARCSRLAVYPGRHIAANPIPREWMPRIPKSANKAKACLYPAEDAKLLGLRRGRARTAHRLRHPDPRGDARLRARAAQVARRRPRARARAPRREQDRRPPRMGAVARRRAHARRGGRSGRGAETATRARPRPEPGAALAPREDVGPEDAPHRTSPATCGPPASPRRAFRAHEVAATHPAARPSRARS